jgi:hypothetical protein
MNISWPLWPGRHLTPKLLVRQSDIRQCALAVLESPRIAPPGAKNPRAAGGRPCWPSYLGREARNPESLVEGPRPSVIRSSPTARLTDGAVGERASTHCFPPSAGSCDFKGLTAAGPLPRRVTAAASGQVANYSEERGSTGRGAFARLVRQDPRDRSREGEAFPVLAPWSTCSPMNSKSSPSPFDRGVFARGPHDGQEGADGSDAHQHPEEAAHHRDPRNPVLRFSTARAARSAVPPRIPCASTRCAASAPAPSRASVHRSTGHGRLRTTFRCWSEVITT